MAAVLLERRPFRTFVEERETLIPGRRKVIDLIELQGILHLAQPPIDNVSPEQALEIVAATSWAKGLAEGVCGNEYVGLRPGSPEYEQCVFNVSHKVAAGTLGMTFTPTAPARRPRR